MWSVLEATLSGTNPVPEGALMLYARLWKKVFETFFICSALFSRQSLVILFWTSGNIRSCDRALRCPYRSGSCGTRLNNCFRRNALKNIQHKIANMDTVGFTIGLKTFECLLDFSLKSYLPERLSVVIK